MSTGDKDGPEGFLGWATTEGHFPLAQYLRGRSAGKELFLGVYDMIFHLILLPQPPECLDYRHMLLCPS